MSLEKTLSYLTKSDNPFIKLLIREGLSESDTKIQVGLFNVIIVRKDLELLEEFLNRELNTDFLDGLARTLTLIDEEIIEFIFRRGIGFKHEKSLLNIMYLLSRVDYKWVFKILSQSLKLKIKDKRRLLEIINRFIEENIQKDDNEIKKNISYELSKYIDNYAGEIEVIDWLLRCGSPGFDILLLVLHQSNHPAIDDLKSVLLTSQRPEVVNFYFYTYLTNISETAVRNLNDALARNDMVFGRNFVKFIASVGFTEFKSVYALIQEIPFRDSIIGYVNTGEAEAKEIFYLIKFLLTTKTSPEFKQDVLDDISKIIYANSYKHFSELLLFFKNREEIFLDIEKIINPNKRYFSLFFLELVEKNCSLYEKRQELLRVFLSSNFEEVKQKAGKTIARILFSRFYEKFDELPDDTKQNLGKLTLTANPSILNDLIDDLSHQDANKRFKSLRIINFLGEESKLGEYLTTLLRDEDSRVRATAVKLLYIYDTDKTVKLLKEAMNDANSRVRANAIEVLERYLNVSDYEILIPYLDDFNNRIRANAVKAIYKFDRERALETLDDMLLSADENMRLSAVWLVGELLLSDKLALIKTLANFDVSMKVRNRAKKTLKKFALAGILQ